ncbi:hypothetical protein ES705_16279 [subsurface metagenome]
MKRSTHEGLERYVRYRIPTDSFLHAVLCNDLMKAMGKADRENREDIFEICDYIYNHVPLSCYGSPKAVKEWLAGRHKV